MPTQILDLTESPTTCPSTSPRKPASAQPTLPVTTGAPANGKSYFNNSPEFLEAQGRVLTDIIDHAKEGRLRSVLKSLMAKHWPVAVDWIGKELLASETAVAPFKDGDDDLGNSDLELPDEESDEESDEGSDDDNNDNESEVEKEIDDLGGQIKAPKGENGDLANGKSTDILPAPVTISSGVKRLRSRYATCVNCEAEFDATSNEPGDCIWHEGEFGISKPDPTRSNISVLQQTYSIIRLQVY